MQHVTGIDMALYYGFIIFTEHARVESASAAATFLSLVRALTAAGTFWIYAFPCACAVWFVWRYTPETKGTNLEEDERQWKK